MPDLADIVRYENEHSALDFKAIQYRKDSHEALLTDVLAMANADVSGERHIVVGVKHRPDGTREFLGVRAAEFVDPAVYQELVRANIEPELDIEYFSLEVDGTVLGVIRISGCDDPPYMMKKDFGRLRAGDCFIRKGSHQTRLTRPDLDRIAARSARTAPQDSELIVSLSPTDDVAAIGIPALGEVQLASDRAADKIKAILREREDQRKNPGLATFGPEVLSRITMASIFGGKPYNLRSDNELHNDLEHIKETYREDDLYELFEKHASKLNVFIRNTGTQYLEDAAVELRIPADPGVSVADRIHPKPDHHPLGGLGSIHSLTTVLSKHPLVVTDANCIIIRHQVGPIKHHRTTPAFAQPLRIAFAVSLIGRTLSLDFLVMARNLPAPLRRQLHIAVLGPTTQAG